MHIKTSEIEIFRFEMPRPQAFDSSEGPKVGGTRGEVAVRLADDHGVWDSGETLREALRGLMRACKSFNLPHAIDGYKVIFTDTVRCDAFWPDGREMKYEGSRIL